MNERTKAAAIWTILTIALISAATARNGGPLPAPLIGYGPTRVPVENPPLMASHALGAEDLGRLGVRLHSGGPRSQPLPSL